MKNIITILLFLTLNLSATIINVPADIDSIQGGINLANPGDTVLVQPGTYVETINFNGKNIVVGSLTLTTGDTSYISQTIISADTSIHGLFRGTVVIFENGEDSTAVLIGFTITNGYSIDGGGIHISNSSPVVSNVIIINNHGRPFGGGIYLENSNAQVSQVKITSNRAMDRGLYVVGRGGGIFCLNSKPTLTTVEIKNNFGRRLGGGIFLFNSHLTILNSLISNNDANFSGGGIYCDSSSLVLNNVIIIENGANGGYSFGGNGGGISLSNSDAEFNNVLIKGNNGDDGGGGILCIDSNLDLLNVTISDNIGFKGGGIYCGYPYDDIDSSNVDLSNVTITNNSAPYGYESGIGGGIFSGSHTRLKFDPTNRCNIYNNHADSLGNDFYSTTDSIISVVVDTFTVLNPDSLHAFPLNKFTFDILHDTLGNPNIIEKTSNLPLEFKLKHNYPNPFNPSTTIEFSIPKSEFVTLKIYNLLGQEVEELVAKQLTPGNYKYNWNVKSQASGVYIYKIQAGEYYNVKKMILLK